MLYYVGKHNMKLKWTTFAIPAKTNEDFIYTWKKCYDPENKFSIECIFDMFTKKIKDINKRKQINYRSDLLNESGTFVTTVLHYIYITDKIVNAELMYRLLSDYNFIPKRLFDFDISFSTEIDPHYTPYRMNAYIEIENEHRKYNTDFEKLI